MIASMQKWILIALKNKLNEAQKDTAQKSVQIEQAEQRIFEAQKQQQIQAQEWNENKAKILKQHNEQLLQEQASKLQLEQELNDKFAEIEH